MVIIDGLLIHAFANWATVPPNASPLRRMLSLPFPNNLKIKLKGFNFEFLVGAELFYTADYFSILSSNYPLAPKLLAPIIILNNCLKQRNINE